MKKISILLFILLLSITSVSAEVLYNPTARFYINDFANVLSNTTEEAVFNIGRNVETKTNAQLVVVTVPNMDGDYIESYANNLFNKWGIGNKEENNGVLLILAIDERKIRIEVGYGLEGAINDAKAGRILDTYSVQPLKSGDYDTAILDAVKQLQGEIYTEYNVDITNENPDFVPINNSDGEEKFVFLGIAIFIFLVIVTKGKILEWLFWAMMFSNGRSGGGRFGGGGGHFGGGGGSSGGGGASRGF